MGGREKDTLKVKRIAVIKEVNLKNDCKKMRVKEPGLLMLISKDTDNELK